jgi:hypothetical protein
MHRIWLCDIDGTGSMRACSKGDRGAVEFVPIDEAVKAIMAAIEPGTLAPASYFASVLENTI